VDNNLKKMVSRTVQIETINENKTLKLSTSFDSSSSNNLVKKSALARDLRHNSNP
jgi:hypothetical protein